MTTNFKIIIGVAAAGVAALAYVMLRKKAAPIVIAPVHPLLAPLTKEGKGDAVKVLAPLTKEGKGDAVKAPSSSLIPMVVYGADGFYNAAAAQYADQGVDGYLNATAGFSGDCPPGQKNCGTYCTPISHHCNGSGALSKDHRVIRITNIGRS